jgi:quercetin dioxygenase-like cupin family protein
VTLAQLSTATGISVSTLSRPDGHPADPAPGGVQAYKMLVPPGEPDSELQSHEGCEWMYVLAGQLRLGQLDLVMKAGGAAEFDTHTSHWFGSAGPGPVELLVLFGPQGERVHLRARTRANRETPARAAISGH